MAYISKDTNCDSVFNKASALVTSNINIGPCYYMLVRKTSPINIVRSF